jgi:hypothetical protein
MSITVTAHSEVGWADPPPKDSYQSVYIYDFTTRKKRDNVDHTGLSCHTWTEDTTVIADSYNSVISEQETYG